jgi:hypothetical protein
MNEHNLVESVAAFIERFVFIKDKQIYQLIALWVIQTHFYKEFEYTGYIFAYSPEPQSGKSRLSEILDLLVANSSGLSHNPSDAILFRTADGKTQLLDEVDTWMNGDFLRGVLNAGFHRGGVVLRNEQQDGGKWNPVSFPVYAPRVMAGIGLKILSDTTRDRTFMIPMLRQSHEERRERFRSRKVKPEAETLKAAIEAWVKANRSRVVELYNAEKRFSFIDHLRDRTIDIVEPLAAILDASYRSPELCARRKELLEAVSLTRKDGEEFLASHRILQELMQISRLQEPLVGNASELASWCALDPQPTEYDIGDVLRRYGFETRSIRMDGTVRKRYELSHAQLTDICARLL